MKGNPPHSRHAVKSDAPPAWMAGLGTALRQGRKEAVVRVIHGVELLFIRTPTSFWMLGPNQGKCRMAWRLLSEAQCLGAPIFPESPSGGIRVEAEGGVGTYQVGVEVDSEVGQDPALMFHVTIRLQPKHKVKPDVSARDLVLLDGRLEPLEEGSVYTSQTGPTAGQVFFGGGDVLALYFQNLTALSPYSTQTGADLSGAVGEDWPEVGLKLPMGEKPLAAGRNVILSDAWLRMTPGPSLTEVDRAQVFMAGLSEVYRRLPLQPDGWYDWPAVARRTLRALSKSKRCTRTIKGIPYFNPYVGGTGKPPESMVQGAILVPLLEYEAWNETRRGLSGRFARTPGSFFNDRLGSVVRWLPGVEFSPENNSDEEVPHRMDSWYLMHSLLNLGRLAELGWKQEQQIFLASVEYAIKTAHHFGYDWPVFYDQRNFKVAKAETAPGEGGEQDVPGLYAHVMIQAWRMTQEARFLEEAEISALKLKHLGFGVLYQTNNTMFGAVALAWLWQITGKTVYKDLGVVSMGSLLSHLWMWEPPISRERPWRTFMGLPPLHDAPYIAAYEEAELVAAGQAYIEAMGPAAPPSVVVLLAEYHRHLLHRARYYFPAELPAAALSPDPKEGIISRDLAIPVEDLYPSADLAGQVGQEVYGAALALVLTTRAFHRRKGLRFTFWCNAPVAGLEYSLPPRGGPGSFRCTLGGTSDFRYEIRVIPHPGGRLQVRVSTGEDAPAVKTTRTREGHEQFFLPGGSSVVISWQVQAVAAKARRRLSPDKVTLASPRSS